MNEKGSERRMVTDLEIARGVETVLRQSDPNAVTTLSGVVSQVEANLGGLDLSHKAAFIRDHITLYLNSRPQFTTTRPSPSPQKDPFALHHSHQLPSHPLPLLQTTPPPPPQQHQQQPQPTQQHQQQLQHHHHHFFGSSHFALPQQQREISFAQPHHQQPPSATGGSVLSGSPAQLAQLSRKESAPKRRGGSGGLNKVCGVSTELQAIVGQPALPRTEIVKQLWAYIRKNNLQDPSNKRKIICDDALRVVFETDSTDMFKMNKLLAKHIFAFDPSKESSQAKRLKADTESPSVSTEGLSATMLISEKLAKFLETGEREMLQSEVHKRVWEYIKVNHLEDPSHPMEILCDTKLGELFECKSISSQQVSILLDRHHLFRQPS